MILYGYCISLVLVGIAGIIVIEKWASKIDLSKASNLRRLLYIVLAALSGFFIPAGGIGFGIILTDAPVADFVIIFHIIPSVIHGIIWAELVSRAKAGPIKNLARVGLIYYAILFLILLASPTLIWFYYGIFW